MSKDQKITINCNLSIEITDQLIASITEAVINALENRGKESVVNFQKPITASAHKGFDNLPDVLTPQQIADHLSVSRQRVYELIRINPEYGGLPNFAVGKSKRINKIDFIKWIDSQKRERDKRFVKK